MKKYGFRVLVGLIAFVSGLLGVWMLVSEVEFRNYCNRKLTFSETEISKTKSPNGKIEIHFKQIIQTENGNALQFVIENQTNENFSYSSYQPKEEESFVMFPLYEVEINGKKINSSWCGTGLNNYQIKSGESKIFQIYARGVVYPWKKGQELKVGFDFTQVSKNFIHFANKEYQTVWSENLPKNNEVEIILLKEKAELEKLTK